MNVGNILIHLQASDILKAIFFKFYEFLFAALKIKTMGLTKEHHKS
jgi:hypothetical protein